MSETNLDKGQISFQTEGRLLQELGERLVASPEVALVELIKNSYDADSPSCDVRLEDDGETLIVADQGSGMAYSDFEHRWMRIATSNKADNPSASIYGRRLTGQKGIGRFAVRFLGDFLELNTVAVDKARKCKTRLIAKFDWPKIDSEQDLQRAKIPFQLFRVDDSEPVGTTLTISKLKKGGDFTKSTDFRTSVLKIVSPLEGLERGRFTQKQEGREEDPGFRVTLPGDTGPSKAELDLAGTVLSHHWARLTIDLNGDTVTYKVSFNDDEDIKPLIVKRKNWFISKGLFADIRFFPRRAGVFHGREVNGIDAWNWVRENHGVAVVDHGFRIKPYGFEDDDWLMLDRDAAHNRREWRSAVAKERFPISKAERDDPAISPMLNLPNNYQLVGAVFVESQPPAVSSEVDDLTPSMDREGFLENIAFYQLFEIVRGGLEYLARQDKTRILDEKERQAKAAAKRAREDFREAIDYIQQSPTLTRADKTRLIQEYTGLADKLVEVEEYDREARRKLETMSSLGVVAGFMTHEATRIISELRDALDEIRALSRRNPSLENVANSLEERYTAFKAHVDYTRTFIDAVHDDLSSKFKAAPQIKRIIDKFGMFAKDRNIDVKPEVDASLEVPAMPVTVYSGVLLNLYTNAVKAIIASKATAAQQRIVFRAWNDSKWHTVEVLDTGVGIPPNLRKRIWDPLFTTTSRLNNPLGSGMGLGLSLVKQLVMQVGGRIDVVDAPAGFSTCFRVAFPWKVKE